MARCLTGLSAIGSFGALVRELPRLMASSVWRRQIAPSVLAAIIGVAVSTIAASLIVQRDNQEAERQFGISAENHFMILQNGINQYLDKLRAVRALFDSSAAPVTRDEFERFARPLLVKNDAIRTLSWVPRVLDADRAAHEREGARQGLPDYGIQAMGADGKITPSPRRSEYYPVFYATLPDTSHLYGLDLSSEPVTIAELDHARDTDRLALSWVAGLVSTGGTQPGFLFSLPVYRRDMPHDTVEQRRENLVGFVHGSIITAKMIEQIIVSAMTPVGVDLFFFYPSDGANALPAYVHASRLGPRSIRPMTLPSLKAGLYWSRDLMADGQPWLTLVMRPMPGGPMVVRHDRAWAVFAFGVVITAVVAAYLWASGRHALRMMRANKKVSDLAQLDALTSLVNRRAFVRCLNQAFAACRRGGKPFAVLYFDLDHFKDVNDTLGHPVGDALLQQVAARVTAAIRKSDVAARFGGDEFAVLQTDADEPAAAGTLAGKIGALLAEPYLIEGNEIHISASIGISRYTPEVAGPDAMMIQADLALYRAKGEGRNCFRFHSADLDYEVQERVMIADELRGAIERAELELYYQPQVELASGRIVGLEALLRWHHPKYGTISPAVFIPIAERTGQIQMLGRWVLDAACRQLRSWQDEGVAPGFIGVNVSALHFKGSSELDRDVAASVDKWSVAPAMIEIELTESVLMDVTQQHNDRFERLRQLGVKIAIDDFGTGYSSLNYLANYPINRVKIAQELVFGVVTDLRNAVVVRAAIRLAHELGINIIAEGVETEAQMQFLMSAGCEHGQGYYFSRPVDAERATEFLRSGTIKPVRRPLRVLSKTAA